MIKENSILHFKLRIMLDMPVTQTLCIKRKNALALLVQCSDRNEGKTRRKIYP